jgi:hypothetical protein
MALGEETIPTVCNEQRKPKRGAFFILNHYVMSTKLKVRELAPLAHFINDDYNGNPLDVCRQINHAIYLLHYLPEGDFEPREVQTTCFILMRIRESLMRMYHEKIKQPFNKVSY